MSDLVHSIIENCRLQSITQRELAEKVGLQKQVLADISMVKEALI